MRNKFFFSILPFLGFLFLLLIRMTMRIKRVREEVLEEFYKNNRRFILAFWHGRQLFMPYSYHGEKIHILISQHGDGEIVSRAMGYFGFNSVRGSSTRGGFKAFRELIKLSRNSDIAITPDGPKGPLYRVQMGIIELARLTSLPIIPVTFSASSRKTLKSWDQFLIPHLFSKGVFIWGDPIFVEKDLAGERVELKRRDLEDSLNRITKEADGFFSRGKGLGVRET
jgi:lysophospholipid acyltransferase (LPLAT)-like uncharacterized protein